MATKNSPATTPAAPESAEKPKEELKNEPAAAQPLPEAPDTVRVKFLRSHPALAYSPGEEADLPRHLHDKYLADGPFFKAIAETESETEE